jgi:hypothetical protein
MPSVHAFFTASAAGGKLYVMGGVEVPGIIAVNVVEVYDPASNQWSTLAPMPSKLFYLSSSAVNGEIYAIGGALTGGNEVNVYDLLTDSWAPAEPLLDTRNRHTSEVVQGEIFVFGGALAATGAPHFTKDTVEALRVYEPTFNIDAGHNGNWWNGLDRNGEGVQVEVSDGGNGSLILVATIYSYDNMGKQIFLIAVGTVNGDTADVDVFITAGGLWGNDYDPALVSESPWGTGTFTASSCDAMHMALMPNAQFQGMGYTNLMYDLIRLTTPSVPCPIDDSN